MGLVWTIYCHTHDGSGRKYVGLTRLTMAKRWNQHLFNAKRKPGKGCHHFWNAIRKYGKGAFSHEVLETCRDLAVANLAEECWIELFDTMNPEKGFNLMKGGLHVPHPVQRLKDRPGFVEKCRLNSSHLQRPDVRAKNRAVVQSPEFRVRIGVIAREAAGRPGSKERRSAASKEVTSRPDVLAKISAAARRRKTHCIKGHPLSEARVTKDGARQCRPCARDRLAARRLRLKSLAAWTPGGIAGVHAVISAHEIRGQGLEGRHRREVRG